MKTEDRRATPRPPVQFRTAFSASAKLEGVGNMLDLSTGGCRIESPVTVEPGVVTNDINDAVKMGKVSIRRPECSAMIL